MNLVGKIFIVLIFIMSVLWMGFTMAVYSTHKNWREFVMNEQVSTSKPLGLIFQLRDARLRNQELKDAKDKLESELDSLKASSRATETELRQRVQQLEEDVKRKDGDLARLDQDRREAVSTMEAVQRSAEGLRTELGTVRDQLHQARDDRDAMHAEVVRLKDEVHDVKNDKKALEEKQGVLAADLAHAQELLRKYEIPWEDTSPPRVFGLILAVRGTDLVEISVGSDDGLRKGHTLEVYRSAGGVSSYRGRIEVTETSPDKAVCKILREYQQGTMERGDRVATKIR